MSDAPIPMELDPAVVQTLSQVTTATLTTLLLKKGLRNVWLRGTRPIRPGQSRLVARAFTSHTAMMFPRLATTSSSPPRMVQLRAITA